MVELRGVRISHRAAHLPARPWTRATSRLQYRANLRPARLAAPGTLTIMPKGSGLIEAGETCPPRRHRGSAIVRIGLLVVGWLIVAALGLVALLRLVTWDSVEPLIVLDALTLVVYLPAWVVAAGALIARRWWLAAAAAVIVAAQLTFVAPELVATAPLPAWARHPPGSAAVRCEP